MPKDLTRRGQSRRLNIALVAPSVGILGGQAVQAERLIAAWRGDAEVNAWLVPVNPAPPGWMRHAVRVKYLRTIATELTYVPLLLRELQRADIVHVFSACTSSFLLAPLPAVLIARLLGKPVVLNYRSGEAPDHLRRSRHRALDAPWRRAQCGAVAVSARRVRGFGSTPTSFPTSSISSGSRSAGASGCDPSAFHEKLRADCTTWRARFARFDCCRSAMPTPR